MFVLYFAYKLMVRKSHLFLCYLYPPKVRFGTVHGAEGSVRDHRNEASRGFCRVQILLCIPIKKDNFPCKGALDFLHLFPTEPMVIP